MCAIAGTINIHDREVLKTMLKLMAHRGPDDQGEYYDNLNKVSLGHCRLSILDLSPAGHQPMLNAHGTIVAVFNGEIYNYKELRSELILKGYTFHSNTDTEVLIYGYEEYGADIFKRLDGMWAVAIYDNVRHLLVLSRDPAGMKPLYVYRNKNVLAFSSEIGALANAVSAESLTLNNDSTAMYLAHRYIFGIKTIYKEVENIPVSSTMSISLDTMETKTELHYVPQKKSISMSIDQAVVEFTHLFDKSVLATLQSDVPVGLFLSGGIDSALVGHTVKRIGHPLKSFTVGFENPNFDEGMIASRIAKHIGLPHTTWLMTAKDVKVDIYKILDAFGQPFADMSALPTYYASRMARQDGYKVILTGDGADELFGGYPTHYLPKLLHIYEHLPQFFDSLFASIADVLPYRHTKLGAREKILRFLLGVRHPYQIAHAKWKLIFNSRELELLILPAKHDIYMRTPDFKEFFDMILSRDETDAVIKADFMSFLPYDCLVKSDISAMQNGIELRSPFLNKDIIDFAWHLPSSMKAGLFKTKIILRKALSEVLPPAIMHLPKRGFVPPLSIWLARELKSVMFDILCECNIAKAGFLNYNYILTLMEEHISRRQDHSAKLWCLMGLVRFYSKLLPRKIY